MADFGGLTHEVVVLPLPAGSGGKVSEAGSPGEASRSCGAGAGHGVISGATGWTDLTLRPGRYEIPRNPHPDSCRDRLKGLGHRRHADVSRGRGLHRY
ncbi:hypothetical protein [Streptomyces shenzhenensis]|uniref:hypothetical protein n=1 Tax=Streptomyces shenzhenensis TaxID=943815 RepID=UPI0033FE2F00